MTHDKPKISKEAEGLIDAFLRAKGEDAVDALYALHCYIEKLEKRRRVPSEPKT